MPFSQASFWKDPSDALKDLFQTEWDAFNDTEMGTFPEFSSSMFLTFQRFAGYQAQFQTSSARSITILSSL